MCERDGHMPERRRRHDQFIDGNDAVVRAIDAGCRFSPGTPSHRPVHNGLHDARAPLVGGVAIQGEDEVAPSVCASGDQTGLAMTATSGPGVSLCSENVSLAS